MLHMSLVALGGAAGSVCRYLVGLWSIRHFGPAFPWGTFIVNILGSFAIGLLIELVAGRFSGSCEMRYLLVTGLLGGFTTFSTYSLDVVAFFDKVATMTAAGYLLASVVLSLAAVFAGLAL